MTFYICTKKSDDNADIVWFENRAINDCGNDKAAT